MGGVNGIAFGLGDGCDARSFAAGGDDGTGGALGTGLLERNAGSKEG